MKKILWVMLFVILLVGCTAISSVTRKLALGMTKQEVLAKCGNPIQSSAMINKDGQAVEAFTYKEKALIAMEGEKPIYTYINFLDGKVIYWGAEPKMPDEEQTRRSRKDEEN